jgi:predicted ABC-type ATPase
MNQKPLLLIVAGANGAGKTTLVNRYRKFIGNIPFINPDDIAKEFNSSYDGRDNILILKASKEALLRQQQMLRDRKSFGFETTFSGNRELKIMKKALLLGYDVRLVYIGLNSIIQNIKRVETRVQIGGHFVPSDIIARRYIKSMNNLVEGVKIASKTYIFDNSKKYHKQVGKLNKNGWIVLKKNQIPKWLRLYCSDIVE